MSHGRRRCAAAEYYGALRRQSLVSQYKMLTGGIRWELKTDPRFGQVAQGRKTQEACLGMRLKNVKIESVPNSSRSYTTKRRKEGQY